MKRINIIRVTKEMLTKALQLPEDADIRDMRWIWESEVLEIKFESKFCNSVYEGDTIPWITFDVLKQRQEETSE